MCFSNFNCFICFSNRKLCKISNIRDISPIYISPIFIYASLVNTENYETECQKIKLCQNKIFLNINNKRKVKDLESPQGILNKKFSKNLNLALQMSHKVQNLFFVEY